MDSARIPEPLKLKVLCNECGKQFCSNYNLRRHQRNLHIKVNSKLKLTSNKALIKLTKRIYFRKRLVFLLAMSVRKRSIPKLVSKPTGEKFMLLRYSRNSNSGKPNAPFAKISLLRTKLPNISCSTTV